ncbi:MAG: ATPase, T2SS/T4P/T4SS family [archaeon]
MKVIDEYQLPNCVAKIKVEIARDEDELVTEYRADFPTIGEGTRLTLNEIKIELLSRTKVPVEKMADSKFIEQVKSDFAQIAEELLKRKLPPQDRAEIEILKEILIGEMLGLGNIEYILLDDNVEEIVINSAIEPAWIYHKKHGWLKSNLIIESEKEIENIAAIIARRSGKQINVLAPLLDAHLPSGDRANSTLSPISSRGNTITIRRFRRKPWTVTELVDFGSVSSEAMALVWMAFEYELNVLITGGTASGKTSFLNACTSFIRPNQRVITIEDTRELTLPQFLHWVALTTRLSNTEGKGEITMLDLLVNSLRMRPDRIIVGEVRRQAEAEVMFEAMNTGHSVYTTFHADTADETIRRFSNPPIALPQAMLDSISINITLFRNRKTGKRAVYQISEIVVEDRADDKQAKPNVLFRYSNIHNQIIKQKESVKFFDEIGMHTGLTPKEIEEELTEKKKIIEWLVGRKVFDLEELALIFAKYYFDKEKVINFAKENKDPKALLKKKTAQN